jgi:hypothetical protein
MYPEDELTSQKIAQIQKQFNWPRTISASAGKNKSDRIMRNMEVLDGTWSAGASIQSTDPKVLLNIKRKNISSSAYLDIINLGTKLSKESKTHSEIILGLPGDSKEAHFESLRFAIDSGIDTIRMFQAILLPGTDMATLESRNKFNYRTAWRVIPGASGIYKFGDREVAVAETEEIIVGSNLISRSDYLDCRVMNLIVESFYNNGIFKEVFNILSFLNLPKFDFLYRLYELLNSIGSTTLIDDLSTLHRTISDFKEATSNSIFETPEIVLEEYQKSLDNTDQDFELGRNEILYFRAIMMMQMPSMINIVVRTLEFFLKEKQRDREFYPEFYSDLARHLNASKSIFGDKSIITSSENVVFQVDFPSFIGDLSRGELNASVLQKKGDAEFAYTYALPDENIEYIKMQENIYMKSALGMGRMLQRSNLNLFFRKPLMQMSQN